MSSLGSRRQRCVTFGAVKSRPRVSLRNLIAFVMSVEYFVPVMTYTFGLPCGCVAFVRCHSVTEIAQSRVIQRRSPSCWRDSHYQGARVWLWELLPLPEGDEPSEHHRELAGR